MSREALGLFFGPKVRRNSNSSSPTPMVFETNFISRMNKLLCTNKEFSQGNFPKDSPKSSPFKDFRDPLDLHNVYPNTTLRPSPTPILSVGRNSTDSDKFSNQQYSATVSKLNLNQNSDRTCQQGILGKILEGSCLPNLRR